MMINLDKIVEDYKKIGDIKKLAKKYGMSYQIIYNKLYRRGIIEQKEIKKIRDFKVTKNKIISIFVPKQFLEESGLLDKENLKVEFIPKRKKLIISMYHN